MIQKLESPLTETQLQGWKDLIECMYKVYNESPLGCQKPLNPLEFACFVTGMNTDHAEDQKRSFSFLQLGKYSASEKCVVKKLYCLPHLQR
jgi:hypothetical protein